MAATNFNAVMDEIFRHEGGLSLIRSDPGNWTSGKVGVGELRGTNYGIAAHAHPNEDIRNLTKKRAGEIYRKKYWTVIRGNDLPVGIDLVTMDPAVNSGPSRGVRWLQEAIGSTPDGKMGPRTIARSKEVNPVPAIQKACARRMGFLRGLRTWGTFGTGWSRRVASVEAVSVRMAVEADGSKARPALLAQKAKAQETANKEGAGAGAVGAGGAGGATLADLPTFGLVGIGVLVLVVVVMLMGQRKHDQERVKAYQEAAEGAKA